MDELRNAIWDFLFYSKRSRRLDDIAYHLGHDIEAIRAAVNHDWFQVNSESVAIAYSPRAAS